MALFDIFKSGPGIAAAGKSKQAGKKATKKAANLASKGYTEAKAPIQAATKKQVGSLTEALAPFEDIYGQEQTGRQAYIDALGLGGPEGTARAREMFLESPGYDYRLGQGEQSVLRNRAALGGLSSGGTLTDLTQFGQAEAGKEWNPWLDRLGGFDPGETAQQRANVLTNIGDAYGTEGVNLSNLATNKFNTLGNLALKRGDINSQYAQDVFGAQNAANQNIWGAISGIGSGLANIAGMGLPGEFGSGGTIGGSLAKRLIG